MNGRMQPSRGRPFTVVYRVTRLVLLAVIPVVVLAGVLIVTYAGDQRDLYMQQLLGMARTVSQATDADIIRRFAVLDALQQAPMLKTRDWHGFYEFAKAAVARDPGDRVVLYEASTEEVLLTLVPFGSQLPVTSIPDEIRKVVSTGQPLVTGLFTGAKTRQPSLAVLEPVREAGAVRYVLAIAFTPPEVSRVLRAQLLPPDVVVTILDSQMAIIARSPHEPELVGRRVDAAFIAQAQGRQEDIYRMHSKEDVTVRGAFSRSSVSGWVIGVEAQEEVLEAPVRRSLWELGGGASVILACLILIAVYEGRRIANPVIELAAMAEAVGRGELPPAQQLDLREAAATADRLRAAAENIRMETEQRERAMAEINRRDHDLAVFHAISEAAGKTLDLQQRLELLVTATCDALGFNGGGIWVADPAGATFTLKAGRNMSAEFTEISVRSAAELPSIGLDGNHPRVLDVEEYPVPRLKRALKRDGYRTFVSISLKAEGEVVGALGLADRTVRQLTSDEAALLTAVGYQLGALLHQAELYAALQRELTERQKIQAGLEAANRELEGISYAMSHVLRAPLRAIEGFAAILLEDYADSLDAECQRMLNAMRKNTMQMSRYLDDFLAFLRISRLPMRPELVDMEALVRSILADKLAPGMAQRDIAIEVGNVAPVCGDRSLLELVWANLLDNAIKFTASRQKARIEVGSRAGDTETVYYVRDNGVGFAAEYTAKLFGLFERLHGTEFPGTGMGLAIVHRIVARHGGRVWADSKEGEGTTIYFALPATEAQPSLPDRVSQAEEASVGSR
jgi:signal transduction histidine kinase